MESAITGFCLTIKAANSRELRKEIYKEVAKFLLSSHVVLVTEKVNSVKLSERHFDFLVLAKIAGTDLTFRYQRWWNGAYEVIEYFNVYLGHLAKDNEGDLCPIADAQNKSQDDGFLLYGDTKRKSVTPNKKNDCRFTSETVKLVNRFILFS